MYANMTTVNDLRKAYHDVCLQEAQLEKEVAAALEKENELEAKMRALRKQMPDTNLLNSDINQLANQISFTASLAHNVSFKVRKLDMVKNRVAQCLQRVGDISDLKTCTEGIQVALDNEEYENAAQLVQRFLEFDKTDMKNAVFDGEDDGHGAGELTQTSLDEAFAKLHEAKRKLQEIVLKKFDEAVKDEDIASVERYFKLFPLLNQKEEGLRKFSNYLCTKISDQAIAGAAVEGATHSEKLGQLYETVAKVIDIHQPMVETFYKPGNMLHVIEYLQSECDRRSKRIFDNFKAKKNLVNLNTVVQKSLNMSSSWAGNAPIKVDPKDIDVLLTEITHVNSRSETYFRFIRKRVMDDIDIAWPLSAADLSERNAKTAQLENLLRNCGLSRSVQELNGMYVSFEEYFLKESTLKAIQMDDASSETSITSYMLDDVFFILKNSVRRASTGGSLDVLCAIINHSVSVLETSYYEALKERVKYGYPSDSAISLDLSQAYNAIQAGRYLQSASEIERAKRLFLTAVNNLDLSCEYLKTLKGTIKEEVKRTINISASRQTEKLDSCLQDMSALLGHFQALIATSIAHINASVLKPRVKLWVDEFVDGNHNLTDEDVLQFEASEGLRPFTQAFLVGVDSVLSAHKLKLTEANYDALVNVFCGELTTRVENAVLKCSFNKVIVPTRVFITTANPLIQARLCARRHKRLVHFQRCID